MKLPISTTLIDGYLKGVTEATATSLPGPDLSRIGEIGQSWRQIGLRPGDLVLLCLPNGRELLSHFFGLLSAGGVPALVAPLLPAARLREMAAAFGARAVAGLRLPAGDMGAQGAESIERLQIATFPQTTEPAALPGEVVMLTSGTSGFSSGCVFDLESLLLNAERHADSIGQSNTDVVLINLPLYFSFALVAQALASMVRGNGLVIGSPPFHVPTYLQILRDRRVTISSVTPVLVKSLIKSDVRYPETLRVLSVGGDALPPDLVAQLLSRRPSRELYLTYGLTQAGPRVSTLAAHAEPPERYGSVGHPVAGTSVFLRGLGDGSGLQQLYVSSATVRKRVIGRIEGRPEHDDLPPQTIATGDAFGQDPAGYLYFVGRLSDFISRSGEKISLATVRRLAAQLPNVSSARTSVFKHEDGTEDFDIELRIDAGSAEQTIDREGLLRGMLRRAEWPRRVHVIPMNELVAHGYK